MNYQTNRKGYTIFRLNYNSIGLNMTENSYTLTLTLNSNALQYMTKFLDLFENTYLYENGTETLENIKCQLNSLKNVESSISDTPDMGERDDVGYGYNDDRKPWE